MYLVRILLTILSITLLLSCTNGSKTDEKDYRVGIIQFTNTNDKTRQGFIDGMTSRGYIDGQNIEYIYFGNAYSFNEIDELLDRIISLKPDLIYSATTPATIRAYKKTKDLGIPVVFGPVNDPVKAGVVSNLRAPGENITGIRLTASDPKRLEWLKMLKPDLKKVLIPYKKDDTSSNITVNLVASAAVGMEIEIIKYPLLTKEDVLNLIDKLPEDIDAIFMPRDGIVMSAVKEFAAVCLEKKLILTTPRLEQVQQGATTGYGFIGYELGKQASRIADLILKGTDPGLIPVETGEDYLFINNDVANKIGLNISDMILRQAYNEK